MQMEQCNEERKLIKIGFRVVEVANCLPYPELKTREVTLHASDAYELQDDGNLLRTSPRGKIKLILDGDALPEEFNLGDSYLVDFKKS
jgi:hypothetical protein